MHPVGKSVHIKTFGCQMNVYDSDRMLALLEAKGFRREADPRLADVILINTCAIRDKSEHKVLSLLGSLKPLKDMNPAKVIGVAGCVGQRMGRKLLQRVPQLDLVFGPDSVDRVVDLVEGVLQRGDRAVEAKLDPITDGRSYSQPLAAPALKTKPAEFLTIMKGCDHFCTYCIVPFVRGREKSRPIPEIIADVERLVEGGAREVTFLGQNINTYGKGTEWKLSALIEEANRVEGLERIRYVTSHPRDLGQDLIDQFGHVEKLMPALHLPFQSGSDTILKRMSRLYTQAEYLERVAALRRARPDLALSTDVIVGFPGETEEDFQLTLDVLRQVRFAGAFLFKYSMRPGTRAESYGDEVPETIKEERLERAQRLAFDAIIEDNEELVGITTPVLIEQVDKKGFFYTGRNPHNKIVHVRNAGAACVGKIVDVEITETTGSNLRGYYVGAPRHDRERTGQLAASL